MSKEQKRGKAERLRLLSEQLVPLADRMMGRSRLGLDAEDIVQMAIERLLRKVGDDLFERSDAQLYSLAARQVHFTYLTFLKRAAHKKEVSEPANDVSPYGDSAPSPETLAAEAQQRRRLEDALQSLNPEERAFVLKAQSVGVPQARREVGWPPKSEYYVLRQLLEQLRSLME